MVNAPPPPPPPPRWQPDLRGAEQLIRLGYLRSPAGWRLWAADQQRDQPVRERVRFAGRRRAVAAIAGAVAGDAVDAGAALSSFWLELAYLQRMMRCSAGPTWCAPPNQLNRAFFERYPRRRASGSARGHPACDPRGGDAPLLPRLRHERDRGARAAGCARRAEAGAPAHPVRHAGCRLHGGPAVSQVGPRGRRRDGQVPPARRRGDLRRHGAHGAAVLDARAADRRAGQFRLGRWR